MSVLGHRGRPDSGRDETAAPAPTHRVNRWSGTRWSSWSRVLNAAWRVRAMTISRLAPVNMRPDFLIIGAQKAGTTSLYAWMTSHPDVLSARAKELHYFDRTDRGSIREYWGQFPLRMTARLLEWRRGRRVVTGEATPYYLFHPHVPARIVEHLPDVKLVVVLRDPVDRAISHYWHEVRHGREPLPLGEALSAETDRLAADRARLARGEDPGPAMQTWSYAARGRYSEQLECWLRHVPRSQMLVVTYDDLMAAPEHVYRRVLEFVGVDPDVAPLPCFDAANVGVSGHRSGDDTEVRRELASRFEDPNRELLALTGVEFGSK